MKRLTGSDAISEGMVLETLYGVKHRLGDPETPWDFSDWTACTCGHIYAQAAGEAAQRLKPVVDVLVTDGLYERVITAIVDACELDTREPDEVGYHLAWAVSKHTQELANRRSGEAVDARLVERQDALAAIDEAIQKVEARQREAMEQVAGAVPA